LEIYKKKKEKKKVVIDVVLISHHVREIPFSSFGSEKK